MARIGLVCEGQTDRDAIECYVKRSLSNHGISNVTFLELPAYRDNTIAITGWGMVINWLSQNPAKRKHYLQDVFAGGLNTQQCDALVIHLDADNLSDSDFQTHIQSRFKTTVQTPSSPRDRGSELRRIMEHVAKFNSLTNSERDRHVVAAAVESTETWCLSAFQVRQGNPERLSGSSLCTQFMIALHQSEGRPTTGRPFRKISKAVRRRKRLCSRTARHASRIESQCYHYEKLISDLRQVI